MKTAASHQALLAFLLAAEDIDPANEVLVKTMTAHAGRLLEADAYRERAHERKHHHERWGRFPGDDTSRRLLIVMMDGLDSIAAEEAA